MKITIPAILVRDTGPGVPERARAKLFQAFHGSVTPGGTGLGGKPSSVGLARSRRLTASSSVGQRVALYREGDAGLCP